MIEFPHLMLVVASVISLASVLTSIVMGRGKAAADKVADIEKALAAKAPGSDVHALSERVDRIEDRTTTIEADMRHLPSRDQTHSMELALKDIQGQMAVLTEKMIPVANTNSRLQDYLMKLGER